MLYTTAHETARAVLALGLQPVSYVDWDADPPAIPRDPEHWHDRPDEMVGIGIGPATGILAVLFADESLVWDRYCKLRQGKLAGLDLLPTLTMRTAQGRYGALYRV